MCCNEDPVQPNKYINTKKVNLRELPHFSPSVLHSFKSFHNPLPLGLPELTAQAKPLTLMCLWSVVQLCLTLCDSLDCSLPGGFVHGIFQAKKNPKKNPKKLECLGIFLTQGSNPCLLHFRRILYCWAFGEALTLTTPCSFLPQCLCPSLFMDWESSFFLPDVNPIFSLLPGLSPLLPWCFPAFLSSGPSFFTWSLRVVRI